MAGDKKNAANKANARKSTGPKSAEGKSVSARNALKHGLSLAPPPDAVRRELACILGAVTDLPAEASDDPSFGAALALAEARAYQKMVVEAERRCLADLEKYAMTRLRARVTDIAFDLDDPTVLDWLLGRRMDAATKRLVRGVLRSNRNRPEDIRGRLERVERYARIAERRRRKAFEAWMSAERKQLRQNEPNLQL